ncbi:MAG: hypothetical protein JF615_00270 [Asticcacaulis sp.]|nr:hypothetical protein [Asticcacaulis sp.]
MIAINRKTYPTPASLLAAMKDPSGELAEASKHYPPLPDKPAKAYEFKAYKSGDVKLAIETLFNNKCAYCESLFGAGGPVDIEHFRPKGAVAEDKAHPGYWWLAMSWDNLLYSCIDCNRMRGQIPVTEGMTHEQVEQKRQDSDKTNTGKKDSFPVRGKHLKPKSVNYAGEKALLIDPTRLDPVDHITFATDANGNCLAIARTTADGSPDPQGQISIQIFGLNRTALVQARSMRWKELRVQGELIKQTLELRALQPTPELGAAILQLAQNQRKELETWANPEKPYSAMTRVFLDQLKDELGW